MTEPKLRIGIAGYGVVGTRRREFIDQHPGMETVAVCDRKFTTPGAFEDGVRYFTNYRELLACELDALFVCLSNDVAAEVTIAGLEAGLHVFCEKPPGRDLKDISDVIACEQRHPDRVLMYGFNHRYHDSVRDALQIVRSGELGKIINLRGVYGKSKIINFASTWRTQRKFAGGGILLDQGIHMVDLIRLFAGEFEEVHSFISNAHWHHDVEDNAYAIMRSRTGVVAMLHSSATQWRHRFQLEISCEGGTIILSGFLTGSKSYGTETLTLAWKTENDEGDPKEQTTSYNHDPSWADEIGVFCQAIQTNHPPEHGTSAEALKTMHLVYRIYCADQDWADRYDLTDQIPS